MPIRVSLKTRRSGRARRDAIGCSGEAAGRPLVAHPRSIEAFEEDCTQAAIVVSAQELPASLRGAGARPQCHTAERRDDADD